MKRIDGHISDLLDAAAGEPDLRGAADRAARLLKEISGLERVEIVLSDREHASNEGGSPGDPDPCACARVMERRFDPSSPWFTDRGSFWTPHPRPAGPEPAVRLCAPADCGTRGFGTAAIVPLQSCGRTLGFVRCLDRRPGVMDREDVAVLEDAATAIATEMARGCAARAVALAEATHRAAMETALQGYVVVQASPIRVVAANSYFADRLGFAPEDIIGTGPDFLLQFLQPEDRPAIMDRLRNRLAGNPMEGPFEVRFTSRDGREVWFIALATSVIYQGKPAVQGVFADITERKKTRKALEESEAKYRNLVEKANFGIGIIQDGRFRFVNEQLALIGGGAAADLEGMLFTEFIHPDELPKVSDYYQRRQRGEPVPAIYESMLLSRTGGAIHVEIIASMTTFEDRPATMVVVRNITHMKEAEGAARASEARFRELFENMASGTIVLLPDRTCLDFKVTDMNLSAEQMCGFSGGTAVGRMASEVLAFLEHAGISETLRRVCATGEPESIPATPVFQGEKTRWWRCRVFRLPSGEIVIVSDDMTRETQAERALKEREQELLHAQKMEAVGRLAGGIAHDFNNLLTVINGFSEVVLGRLGDQEPASSEMAEVLRAGTRAAELTNQLLSFSRRQVLRPSLLDLNAVVAEMEKLLRRLIGENIRLVTRMHPGIKPVLADKARIEQAIMNLVVNAKDAMPEGGTLAIETGSAVFGPATPGRPSGASPGEYVLLSLTDTGVGIRNEIRDFIFEPFFTTKEVGKGTGLGLSMVYGTVKQSGGYVILRSEPGHGSTFTIYLPAVEGTARREPGDDSRDAPAARGETVLLAEDDPGVRMLTRKLLEGSGYGVIDASNGIDALSACRTSERSIDLLLTDVVMPGMNGKALYESVRALRPGIKVLFMSGYADGAGIKAGLVEMGLPFIEKPFGKAVLARKVREALGG